jgi:hypothetical protein
MNLLAADLKPANFKPGRRKGRGNVDLLQAERARRGKMWRRAPDPARPGCNDECFGAAFLWRLFG